MNHADIELPARIAALERDHRGYPIPYIVLRDAEGKAIFAVNDIERTWQAVDDNLCHICGQQLEAQPWFVGGPGSAFANGDDGIYNDGPMHHECLHFALKVCPHLLNVLTKPVALEPIKAKLKTEGIGSWDNTTIPGVPPVFVAVQAYRCQTGTRLLRKQGPTFFVPKPYRKVEYWQRGVMLDKREGERQAGRRVRELKAGVP